VVLLALVLNAGGVAKTNDINRDLQNSIFNDESYNDYHISYTNYTFEEAIQEFATDVVIAQYINHKPSGESLTEFEFVVQERVFGNAEDRIFVYKDNYDEIEPNDSLFSIEVEYLIPLINISSPYVKMHEDEFRFIYGIIIDLNNIKNSSMRNESLSLRIEGLDLSKNITKHDITTYISSLTKNNTLAREYIRSGNIKDIINDSPCILVVEVNEPHRLVDEQASRDWMETDIYYCTVIKVLKGEINIGDEIRVIFFADTVKKAEQHIIAVEHYPESSFIRFTSKNSLFRMDQLDEILAIIG